MISFGKKKKRSKNGNRNCDYDNAYEIKKTAKQYNYECI